jgi:predicted MFS family arabinose efflux permease
MQSFSNGTIQILSPIFAATMLGVTGILGVIAFDFATLIFACLTLIYFVKIPFISNAKANEFSFISYLSELRSGFNVILDSSLLSKLLLLMAFINLVAGITYFNLISPMILSRSGNDSNALALVNGALGLGGIIGGLLSTFIPTTKSKIKTMFFCVGLSFLLGDILFAAGNSKLIWVIAGFLSSVFIPIFSANESYFWRTIIPIELQGRAFSFKYALQSGMVPIGMLLGGILADYVFEPFMLNVSNPLTLVVGSGKGSGMAVMFLLTGVMGTILSVLGFFSRTLLESEWGL